MMKLSIAFVLILIVLLAAPTAAQQGFEMPLCTVTPPRVSGQLAYGAGQGEDVGELRLTDLRTGDTVTLSEHLQLVSSREGVNTLDFSSDGRYLAFPSLYDVSSGLPMATLDIVDVTTGELTLARHPFLLEDRPVTRITSVSWSPDDSKLAVYSLDLGAQITIISPDGRELGNIPVSRRDYNDALIWSVDGQYLLLYRGISIDLEELYDVLDVNTMEIRRRLDYETITWTQAPVSSREVRRFFPGPPGGPRAEIIDNGRSLTVAGCLLAPNAFSGQLAWRPVTTEAVAFASAAVEAEAAAGAGAVAGRMVFSLDGDLYTAGMDGGDVTALTSGDIWESTPVWSPDGTRIAYSAAEWVDGVSRNFIYIMNADGSGTQRLEEGSLNALVPAWSPDGNRLAYACERAEFANIPQICITEIANPNRVEVLTEIDGFKGVVAWSPNGLKLMFSNNVVSCDELYEIDLTGMPGDNIRLLLACDDLIPYATWGPDSQLFVYETLRNYNPATVVRGGGGMVVVGSLGTADWLADGRLAMYSWQDGGTNILLQNLDTGESENIRLDIGMVFNLDFFVPSGVAGATAPLPALPPGAATAPAGGETGAGSSAAPTAAPGTTSAAAAPASCPGLLPSQMEIGGVGRVTPGSANNLRSDPSTSGARLGQIPGGATFNVLAGPVCADGFAWWEVEYRGQIGWTVESGDGEYWIEPVSGAPSAAPGQASCEVTTLNPVNLRARPTTTAAQEGSRAGGTIIIVNGQAVGDDGFAWWRVGDGGIDDGLWVREDLVREGAGCADLPLVAD